MTMKLEVGTKAPATGIVALIRLLRPHQWLKNAFVAAPLFFTPEKLSAAAVGRVGLGLIAFCAVSSAVYVFNDALDREADRAHPLKRLRPLAAGTVSLPAALAVMAGLLVAGLGLALWLARGRPPAGRPSRPGRPAGSPCRQPAAEIGRASCRERV